MIPLTNTAKENNSFNLPTDLYKAFHPAKLSQYLYGIC